MTKLNVLFIKDNECWVAQCLQYDIAAQGDTISDAKAAFEYAIAAEASFLDECGDGLDAIPSAPKFFWDMYEKGSELSPIQEKPMRLPSKLAELTRKFIPDHMDLRVA